MTTFKIPLTNIPQKFQIALANKEYSMTCKWNDSEDAGWVLDIDNAIDNTPLIYNIPLVTGVNILDGLEYLGIDGQLFVFTDGDDFAVPTLLNLGIESNLYFQTEVVDGTV